MLKQTVKQQTNRFRKN